MQGHRSPWLLLNPLNCAPTDAVTLIFISTWNKCEGVLQRLSWLLRQHGAGFSLKGPVLCCVSELILSGNTMLHSHPVITVHGGALWILWVLWLLNSKHAFVKKKSQKLAFCQTWRLSSAAEVAFIWQATAMHDAHDIRIRTQVHKFKYGKHDDDNSESTLPDCLPSLFHIYPYFPVSPFFLFRFPQTPTSTVVTL